MNILRFSHLWSLWKREISFQHLPETCKWPFKWPPWCQFPHFFQNRSQDIEQSPMAPDYLAPLCSGTYTALISRSTLREGGTREAPGNIRMEKLLKFDNNIQDQAQWDPGAVGCILRRQLGLGDGTQEKRLEDYGRKLQHNPLMISSAYVWAKSGDSLLTNKTWQKWWAAPRLLGHRRLWFPSRSYSLWLFSQACSGGEGHTAEKEGCPLPIGSNKLRLSAWKLMRRQIPLKNHWVGLGADFAHCKEGKMASANRQQWAKTLWQLMRKQIPPKNAEWAWEQTPLQLNSRY